jgi:hypothetical protein
MKKEINSDIKIENYVIWKIWNPRFFGLHTLFGTELHLKNAYYLYSACSNSTNAVLVIILNMIIGKGLDNETAKFYWCVITQAIT